MSFKHMSHVTTSGSNSIQAHVMYQWLTYVNQFPIVDNTTGGWTGSTVYEGSTGSVNDLTPQSFFDTSGPFVASFVGKYIAVKDPDNPSNNMIAMITGFVSPTELTLELASLFKTSASDLTYRIFDPSVPLAPADYFVIQTPVSTGPKWQVKCTLPSVFPPTAALSWELGFLGGWDSGTTSWTVSPQSTVHYSSNSPHFTFCVADDVSGFFYMWTDSDATGPSSSKNALWVGNLSPFHSPVEPGVPKDLSYAAIFGSPTAGVASNVSRDTSVADNFSVGEILGASGLVTPLLMSVKTLLSTGDDMLTVATAKFNPRSGAVDDYDAIAITEAPEQAIRGRVPGVRLLNDSAPNRTSVNTDLTYVIGNGIGASWNGKAPN